MGVGIDGDLLPSLPFASAPFQCMPEVLFLFCKEGDRVTKPGGWAGSPRGLFSSLPQQHLHCGVGTRTPLASQELAVAIATGRPCIPLAPGVPSPLWLPELGASNSFASWSGRQGHTKQDSQASLYLQAGFEGRDNFPHREPQSFGADAQEARLSLKIRS